MEKSLEIGTNSSNLESLDSIISKLPLVRRGFSPDEVRKRILSLRNNIDASQSQIQTLQAQIEDLSAKVNLPAPELTEAIVAKFLGEQASEILRSVAAASMAIREKADKDSKAIMTAAQIEREEASNASTTMLTEARQRATELISSAQAEAKQTISKAEDIAQERLATQEALAKDVVARANQLATDTIQSAQRSSDKIINESQKEATSLISAARETRTEILSDLKMRADEVRSHIDTLSRTRGWFIEMLRDAQRRVTSVETALSISISSDLESLEGSFAALNLSTIEIRPSASMPESIEDEADHNLYQAEILPRPKNPGDNNTTTVVPDHSVTYSQAGTDTILDLDEMQKLNGSNESSTAADSSLRRISNLDETSDSTIGSTNGSTGTTRRRATRTKTDPPN